MYLFLPEWRDTKIKIECRYEEFTDFGKILRTGSVIFCCILMFLEVIAMSVSVLLCWSRIIHLISVGCIHTNTTNACIFKIFNNI